MVKYPHFAKINRLKKIEEHISLDGIDKAILRVLMENARIPVQEIARQLNLSGSAVHQRIKKLEDANLIQGSYLKINLPFSIGFLNVPAFLIFIPITTLMARLGARTVHKIDKNKISKLLGIFLLIVAIKFFYEYIKL